MNSGSGASNLFLSYNSADRQSVLTIRSLLQEKGISTFLDRDNLVPGLPWLEALQEAIEKSKAVAVFIGGEGLGVWQKREMALALDRQARAEKTSYKFPVIPILLPQADIEKAPDFSCSAHSLTFAAILPTRMS